jgi:hypothetical protein
MAITSLARSSDTFNKEMPLNIRTPDMSAHRGFYLAAYPEDSGYLRS